jgi:hypothetical protein
VSLKKLLKIRVSYLTHGYELLPCDPPGRTPCGEVRVGAIREGGGGARAMPRSWVVGSQWAGWRGGATEERRRGRRLEVGSVARGVIL